MKASLVCDQRKPWPCVKIYSQDTAPLQPASKLVDKLATPSDNLMTMFKLVLGMGEGQSEPVASCAHQYPTGLRENLRFMWHSYCPQLVHYPLSRCANLRNEDFPVSNMTKEMKMNPNVRP